MTEPSQSKAVREYRARLTERGIGRFEVLGRDGDRALIRALAKRLIESDAEAGHIRTAVARAVSPTDRKGGIYAALRRSPLVGLDIDVERDRSVGRKVEL